MSLDLKVLAPSDLTRQVCVVLGTRPAIVKMAPIIRQLMKTRTPFFVLHTGQHYSYNMDQEFFEDLKLPRPKYHVRSVRRSHFHGEQTAKMLSAAERALLRERPVSTLVGGDANTNLAGGLAARKLGILLGHVEAGLRSHDWRMPEEHNRVILDHISDFLFAPTRLSRNNLLQDNVKGRIFVVGNTIADSVLQNRSIARVQSKILSKVGLNAKEYNVLTAHREENVDSESNLRRIARRITDLATLTDLPLIFPVHPRTSKRLSRFGLTLPRQVHLMKPIGYLDFLWLLDNSNMVITDSGGIQEEASILHVPCVTIRENTERPETALVGANIVCGLEKKPFLDACRKQLNSSRTWSVPYQAGASARIVSIIRKHMLSN